MMKYTSGIQPVYMVKSNRNEFGRSQNAKGSFSEAEAQQMARIWTSKSKL